jgi:hypothetical protein
MSDDERLMELAEESVSSPEKYMENYINKNWRNPEDDKKFNSNTTDEQDKVNALNYNHEQEKENEYTYKPDIKTNNDGSITFNGSTYNTEEQLKAFPFLMSNHNYHKYNHDEDRCKVYCNMIDDKRCEEIAELKEKLDEREEENAELKEKLKSIALLLL